MRKRSDGTECDDPEACVTDTLLDAGKDREAVRVMVRTMGRFLHSDWPEWKREIRDEITTVRQVLENHIAREQEMPNTVRQLEARHDRDVAKIARALWGEDPEDDSDDSVVAVTRTVHKCLTRWRRILIWVGGILAVVVSGLVLEFFNSGAFRAIVHNWVS